MKKLFFVSAICFAVSLVSCKSEPKTDAAAAGTETTAAADASAATDPAAAAATPVADPAAAEQTVDPDMPKTTVQFAEMEYDFGKVKAGEMVTHEYKFKNTGKEPLIISSAKGSCGCTVPEYPKEPIAPGASAAIKVQFDSKGKSGKQTKTVTIQANTDPNPTRLTIKGDVEGDPNAAAAAPAVQVQPAAK